MPRAVGTARVCAGPPRAREPEDAGPATAARARASPRVCAPSPKARALRRADVAKVARPSWLADPQRAALEPPLALLAHLGTRDGAVSTRRWVARGARAAARRRRRRRRRTSPCFGGARRRGGGRPRLVAAAARRGAGTRTTRLSRGRRVNRQIDIGIRPRVPPTPLTGPTTRDRGVARVAPDGARASRLRPPPPSSESGAAGSADSPARCGWARTAHGVRGRHRGTHRRALRRGAGEGGRGSARRRRVADVGVGGGGAFASMAGNAGHVGHVVSRVGVGADEETLVTVEVRVRAFERVALRPIVTFAASPSGTSGSSLAFGGGGVPGVVPADGAPAATLRCVPYEIPLADLLLPDDAMRGDRGRWERLWTLLPASFELAARVDRHAAAAAEGIGADVRSDFLKMARIGASGAPDVRAPRWRRRRRRSAGLNEKGTRKKSVPTKRKAKTRSAFRVVLSRGAARTRWAPRAPRASGSRRQRGTASISWSWCSHPARACAWSTARAPLRRWRPSPPTPAVARRNRGGVWPSGRRGGRRRRRESFPASGRARAGDARARARAGRRDRAARRGRGGVEGDGGGVNKLSSSLASHIYVVR